MLEIAKPQQLVPSLTKATSEKKLDWKRDKNGFRLDINSGSLFVMKIKYDDADGAFIRINSISKDNVELFRFDSDEDIDEIAYFTLFDLIDDYITGRSDKLADFTKELWKLIE